MQQKYSEKSGDLIKWYLKKIAETERFELSIQLPVYTLSRRAPSTTRTRLHFIYFKDQQKIRKLFSQKFWQNKLTFFVDANVSAIQFLIKSI